MDSKDLEYFQEVCRCKSITQAAKKLFISPQGLSKAIKNLESEVQAPLFVRTRNGVEITEFGECLLRQSQILINDMRRISNELDTLKIQQKSILRLASAYGVFRLLHPEFIFDFKSKNLDIHLEYMEDLDYYIDQHVKDRTFDFGFTIGPVDTTTFISKSLFSSPISLLVHKDHWLSVRNEVSLEELRDEPFVIENKYFKIHHNFYTACSQYGFVPNVIFTTSGFSLCHKLVAENECLSIVVDAISNDMITPDLVRIPLKEELNWDALMIYRRDCEKLELIERVENFIKDYLKKINI